MSKSINLMLNGALVEAQCRPDTTVLEWLRGEAGLRGSKEGCAEGDCGACTILVSSNGPGTSRHYQPTNACIALMGQLESASLITVEGLSVLNGTDHPIQEHMAQNGSSQCGFCTPGIVSALAGLLHRNPGPGEQDVHDALAGNLCRCTGYRPIVEAALAAAKETQAQLPEPGALVAKPSVGTPGDCEFILPTRLEELIALKSAHPDAILLAGGTDSALDVAHARARWPKVIVTRHVGELQEIAERDDVLRIGGAVTWEQALPQIASNWPEFGTLIRRFGSVQIRSMGTLAGNLATASPIGDGAPSLIALEAQIEIAGPQGKRKLPLEDFFTGYRTSVLKADEVISAVEIPLPSPEQIFSVYKVSKRYDQDISTVCGAFRFTMAGDQISACRIAYGGMAATPYRCKSAEAIAIGSRVSPTLIKAVQKEISNTFQPLDDMRGSAAYRATVAPNLFERFCLELGGVKQEVMSL